MQERPILKQIFVNIIMSTRLAYHKPIHPAQPTRLISTTTPKDFYIFSSLMKKWLFLSWLIFTACAHGTKHGGNRDHHDLGSSIRPAKKARPSAQPPDAPENSSNWERREPYCNLILCIRTYVLTSSCPSLLTSTHVSSTSVFTRMTLTNNQTSILSSLQEWV